MKEKNMKNLIELGSNADILRKYNSLHLKVESIKKRALSENLLKEGCTPLSKIDLHIEILIKALDSLGWNISNSNDLLDKDVFSLSPVERLIGKKRETLVSSMMDLLDQLFSLRDDIKRDQSQISSNDITPNNSNVSSLIRDRRWTPRFV